MASSSSTIDKCNHDVFVSFRGETRKKFTSHLCKSLSDAHIKFFIDEKIDKGEVLTPSLHRAIERAKISIVVFSSNYASSSFCLDELVKILECQKSQKQIVLPIFYEVDPSDLRNLKGSYEEAFGKHEVEFKGRKRCREEDTKIQRWKLALEEAANVTGWHVQVTNNCDEAVIIQKITQWVSEKLNCEPISESKGREFITIPLVSESTAEANLKEVWKYLMDPRISRVGIWGMGGIGKTTIARHINNQLKKDKSFEHVYWVTVSNESSIYKLQSDVAKEIGFDLSREEDESERAARIYESLYNKKNFVLILDDMWKSYELEEVGIPTLTNGRKLLVTTRDHRVCKGMKCQEIVKVNPLSEEEAMELFIRECGHKVDDNSKLRSLVESVAKECDGLPLAIVAIARSTRGFVDDCEWRNILNELQKPSDRQNHDMEEKVFELLKVSYDRLRNDNCRQGLQYCAMHAEDKHISRDDLISYWIAGGVIDELDSMQEEFDLGHFIINKLIDASLLEGDDTDVKMHDVVRDMILTITRENLMVKAGLQLKDFPKFTNWSDNLEGISIMDNYDLEGCSFNVAPNCYKLRILLMQNNFQLLELPNCFFVHMQNLTILDMRELESLKLLPSSISLLGTLRILNLEGCSSLKYVPSLAALKDLRRLNLSRTNLDFLPEGMEKLVNLKSLLIVDVKELLDGLIPNEVLKELSLLQELDLRGSYLIVDPNALISLTKLERLCVEFQNFFHLNLYLESRQWQRLGKYVIFSRERENEMFYDMLIPYSENDYDKVLLWCKDNPSDADFVARKGESSDFVIPFNVEQLELLHWDGAFINICFAHLKHLELVECKLRCLISVAFDKQQLPNLIVLKVIDCEYMEEIIKGSSNQTNHKSYSTIELPKLRELTLVELPKLKNIYKGNMELPSLEFLEIDECENLERLPFRKRPRKMLMPNICLKWWWNSLQWDDEDHKQAFEEFYSGL